MQDLNDTQQGYGDKGLGFSLCAAPSPTIRKCPLISETEVQGIKVKIKVTEKVSEKRK